MSSLLRAARQIVRASTRANLPPPPPQPLHSFSGLAAVAVCRAAPLIAAASLRSVWSHRARSLPAIAFRRSFSTVRETPPPQPFDSTAAAIEHAAAAARGSAVTPSLHPHPLPTPRPPVAESAPTSETDPIDVRRVVVLGTGGSDPLNLLRALKKESAGPSAAPSVRAFEERRHPDATINGYAFSSQVAQCCITPSGVGVGSGRSQLQLNYYRSWPFLDFARARVWDRCMGARQAILVIDAQFGFDALTTSEILSQSPADWGWIVLIDHAEYAQPTKLTEIDEQARAMLSSFGFDGAGSSVIRGSTTVALSPSKSIPAESELGSAAMRKLLSAIDIAAQSRSPHDVDRGFIAAVRSVEPVLSSRRVDPHLQRSIVLTHPRSSPSFFTRRASALTVGSRCDWLSPTGGAWTSQVLAIRSEADGSMEITVDGAREMIDPASGLGSEPAPATAAGSYLLSSRAVGVERTHTFEADVYMLSRAEGGRYKPFVHQSRAFLRFGSLHAIAALSAASGSSAPSHPASPALEGVVQILTPRPAAPHSDFDRPPSSALCAGHALRVRLMLRRAAVVAPELSFALMDSADSGRVLAVGSVSRPLMSALSPVGSVSVPLPAFPLRSRLSSWLHSLSGVSYAWVGWWLGPTVAGLLTLVQALQMIFYAAVAAACLYVGFVWAPEHEDRRAQQQRKRQEREQQRADDDAQKRTQAAWWSWPWGRGSDTAAMASADSARRAHANAAAPSSTAAASASSSSSSPSRSADQQSTAALVEWAMGWIKQREEEEAEAIRKAQAGAEAETNSRQR